MPLAVSFVGGGVDISSISYMVELWSEWCIACSLYVFYVPYLLSSPLSLCYRCFTGSRNGNMYTYSRLGTDAQQSWVV